jgi:hypothetical protein
MRKTRMRTPAEISKEAAEHLASSSTAMVPPNVLKLVRLQVEFMQSVAAALAPAAAKTSLKLKK